MHVINGGKKESINKHIFYVYAYNRAVDKFIATGKREDLIKICILVIKCLNSFQAPKKISEATLNEVLERIILAKEFLGSLKPKEFVNLFPITKKINKKNQDGLIDYYYTLSKVNELDPELPIGLQIEPWTFLIEYFNRDIQDYILISMKVIGALQTINGEPSIYEDFLKKNGVDKKRKKPRYLKLL